MKSLDPRVTRLPSIGEPGKIQPKASLDQLGTFEVFVQPKEGKPFQHEGVVHAPDREMAFVLAKEAFTRRFQCVSLYVADTRDVFVSPLTEGTESAYVHVPDITLDGEKQSVEIYHLAKRGKQHVHAGTVQAVSEVEAMSVSKRELAQGKVFYNVWAIRTDRIRFTSPEEKTLWITLPDKKFRDAADYKGGDKLKEFLERTAS